MPVTCALRKGMRLRTVACINPGTSITKRRGDSTICNCGVTGPLEAIAIVGALAPGTMVTDGTSVAGVRAMADMTAQTATIGTHSWARTRGNVIPASWENLRGE